MPRSTLGLPGVILAGFLLVMGLRVCRGEILEFQAGGRLVAPVSVEGDVLFVAGPLGTYRFPREAFRRVEPGGWPPSEWPSRLEAVSGSPTQEQFAAAWWAIENGLVEESVALLRQIHENDPTHPPTARMVDVIEALAQPCVDPPQARDARLCPPHLAVLRTEHLILCHRRQEGEARDLAEHLERVLRGYFLSFAGYGVPLKVPRERALILCDETRNAYRARLAQIGAGDFGSNRGFFHPTLLVVLTHDGRSEPATQRAQRAIDQARAVGARESGREGSDRERLRIELDRRQLLLDAERVELEYSATAHELVRLLSRTSGLSPRHESFPRWLHEGLAMQFEVCRGGRWSGIGRLNPIRRPSWVPGGQENRLSQLLSDRVFSQGSGNERAYAESWAFVFFLRKTHPDAFLSLLERLRGPAESGRNLDDRVVDALRISLGSEFEDLQDRWVDYITALEDHRGMGQ